MGEREHILGTIKPARLSALRAAMGETSMEAGRAMAKWPPFNSAHEGFAVLLEEVDELKAHVWTNDSRRDLGAMREEAIQVAAMALRFAAELTPSAEDGKP